MFGFPENSSADETGGYAVPPGIPDAPEMTERERALRDLFVSEYLVDYDQVRAAQRCGFGYQFAVEYATKLMGESYVQQRISQIRIDPNVNSNALEEYNKRRIREGLIAEASYKGPGSSHAARVSALKALAELHGMTKIQGKAPGGGATGGVMAVPGIADLDAWEQQASLTQDNLAKHADTGE